MINRKLLIVPALTSYSYFTIGLVTILVTGCSADSKQNNSYDFFTALGDVKKYDADASFTKGLDAVEEIVAKNGKDVEAAGEGKPGSQPGATATTKSKGN